MGAHHAHRTAPRSSATLSSGCARAPRWRWTTNKNLEGLCGFQVHQAHPPAARANCQSRQRTSGKGLISPGRMGRRRTPKAIHLLDGQVGQMHHDGILATSSQSELSGQHDDGLAVDLVKLGTPMSTLVWVGKLARAQSCTGCPLGCLPAGSPRRTGRMSPAFRHATMWATSKEAKIPHGRTSSIGFRVHGL